MHINCNTLLTAKPKLGKVASHRTGWKEVHKNDRAHAAWAPAKMSEGISFRSKVSTMFLAALSLYSIICLPVTMLLHPKNEYGSSHRIHKPTVNVTSQGRLLGGHKSCSFSLLYYNGAYHRLIYLNAVCLEELVSY